MRKQLSPEACQKEETIKAEFSTGCDNKSRAVEQGLKVRDPMQRNHPLANTTSVILSHMYNRQILIKSDKTN